MHMKVHSAELVNAVNESRSPVVITRNGHARAVVMDATSYEQMQEALTLLKILSQSDAAYRKGHWKSQKQVEADFEKRRPSTWAGNCSIQCKPLGNRPMRGRMVPELAQQGVSAYREILVSRYRMIYHLHPEAIQISAVMDASRDAGDLLLRRLLR